MIFKKLEAPLTGEEMAELEGLLDDKCIHPFGRLKPSELAARLNLKIEQVSKSDLPKKVEAILCPANNEDKQYNGIIKVNEDSENSDFSYIHEIMHYIIDVGVGNKVESIYTRKKRGHTNCFHEQVINYLTAAYCMPKEEIIKNVEYIDEMTIDINFARFIRELGEKYNQTDNAVIRRIQEMRKIRQFEKEVITV